MAELSDGIKSLANLLEEPLTDVEIAQVMDIVDRNQDGEIEVDEFFTAFQVQDDTLASIQRVGDRQRSALRPKVQKAPKETNG